MNNKDKIITYGCTLNKADSEKILYLLESNNVELPEDMIIINTCGVKLQTENKIIDHIKRLQKEGKRVIVCGCLTSINLKRVLNLKPFAVLDVYSLNKIVEAVKKGGIYLSNGQNRSILNIPQIEFTEKYTAIIPISYGCLGNCTYCGTKFARKKLMSRYIKDIINQIKNTDKKEIFLTSEDCGCYGFDIGTNIIELMDEIISLDKEIIVRIGMANPTWIMKYLDDFIERIKDRKFYKFIHVPVQSGSNKVLKSMNRMYTREDFIEIVKEFKNKIPDITIATDIIVGFPTETEQDFEETKDLILKTRPCIVNISKFFPRPNTEAAKMKKINSKIIKIRSVELTRICNKISEEEYKKEIGRTTRVFYYKNYGKTQNYKKIILNISESCFVNAKIKKYSKNCLYGTVL